MDTYRAILAIVLAFFILLGYQFLFVKPEPEQQGPEKAVVEQPVEIPGQDGQPQPVPKETVSPEQVAGFELPESLPARMGRDIVVETNTYTAVIAETGGGIKSFKLNNFKETHDADSGRKELVSTESLKQLPLYFSWGVDPGRAQIPSFTSDRENLKVEPGADLALTLTAQMTSGLQITRRLVFDPESYLLKLSIDIDNFSETPLKGSPYLSLTNRLSDASSARYSFSGPAALVDGKLQEIKEKEFKEAGKTITGNITWAAFEGTYFMTGVVPENSENISLKLSALDGTVNTLMIGKEDIIPANGHLQYNYQVYLGPKKMADLKAAGSQLDRIIYFGWFDVLAKPALHILNFFYKYVGNYGVSIILVTILIKLLFWPIAQKGLKSMKNMQKIQPKMAKLKEKYKDDKTRLNEEMMNLYKTYKVNPLGGCLPMILQIPVFFALYKVLLQAIELRHAPFMLWITDLSAPDRLMVGIDIPFLGGVPVLTLLMGASMFLQQKMSPSSPDPTQAKIMMFLPVIFTFMFLNFASGLVLYWLVNNLLSIAQQYMINKQPAAV